MLVFSSRRFFEDGKTENSDVGFVETGISGWEYYNKYALVGRKFHFVCVVLRLYKRDFMLSNRLRFEEHLYHEDNLFTPMVCYYAKSVKVIPDILYVYRIRQQSITQVLNVKRLTDTVHVANTLAAFFLDKKIDKSVVNREIAGLYLRSFMPDVDIRQRKHERELISLINWDLCKSVCTYPRYKMMCRLLKISPKFMRMYLALEAILRKVVKGTFNLFL